jgi:hypothetical protein
VLFYFTADGRIDFRELVKDLAAVFKTRIELRQIGVRDETKILGGIGICGRPLCCHTHLSEFIPVSIKMAKEQNLSLNPTKISGVCGRLMCCLKHEEETYEELNRGLPNVGDQVTTEDGNRGEVHSVNVLRQLVKVIIDNGDEKELRECKVDELNFRPKKRKDVKLTAEEMKELAALEDEATETEKPQQERRERNKKHDRGDKNDRNNNDRNNNERHHKNDRFNKQDKSDKQDKLEQQEVTEAELPQEVPTEGGQQEAGEHRNHKKRRFNRGKRHFGKNKQKNNASEE